MKIKRWMVLQGKADKARVRKARDKLDTMKAERDKAMVEARRLQEERNDTRRALQRQIEARGAAVVWEPPPKWGTPVAYMRRWAYDNIDVMKMKKAERPRGWELHDVTVDQLRPDDVPLYVWTA